LGNKEIRAACALLHFAIYYNTIATKCTIHPRSFYSLWFLHRVSKKQAKLFLL